MKKIMPIVLVLVLLVTLVSVAFADDLNYICYTGQANRPYSKTVAHRGLSAAAPENTLAAYELAGEMGFSAIEFDIWPSADGKWVVMHDEKVNRTTDKTGKITEMTYAEIQDCTIDAGNCIDRYPGQKIPTLEQALEVCEEYNATPFIEIKGGTADEVSQLTKLLAEYKNHNEFVFISFTQSYLIQIKSAFPKASVYWLVSAPTEESIAFCLANNIDGLDFNYKKTSTDMINKIVDSGLTAGAWTVDSVDSFSELSSLKVDCITTNSIIVKEKPCTHMCHSDSSFSKFIWKIVSFFINLFGEQYCTCGVRH